MHLENTLISSSFSFERDSSLGFLYSVEQNVFLFNQNYMNVLAYTQMYCLFVTVMCT